MMSKTVVLRLDILPAGLNGSDGLIRQNYHSAKKVKEKYRLLVRSLKIEPIRGKVRIEYIRYSNRMMDWDNAAASFKHIGDALVLEGILDDDSPRVIAEFIPRQVLCKEHYIEIIITKL